MYKRQTEEFFRSLGLATRLHELQIGQDTIDEIVMKGISMQIEEKSVVAFIGPSGCGKSTFLRLFNRMNDLIPATRLEGEIRIDGHNIYAKGVEVDELRKNVGMVFQRPNPFPKSIFENVAYGPVSYTHLDVYKRQVPVSCGNISWERLP